jgi:hypothetical protein
MAIKLSNSFITKLQMTSGNLNVFEDFNGTAAIISGSNLGGGGSSFTLLAKLDASNTSSYASTTWSDLVGSNDATVVPGSGQISYDTNASIKAFELDGSSGQRIEISDSDDISLSTSTTKAYSLWFNTDAVGFVSFSRTLMAKQSGNPVGDGFWMGINSSNQLVARVTSDGGSTNKTISGIGATISTGTWYMATMIAKVSSTSNTFKLFINSTEVGSTSGGGSAITDSNNLYLGGIQTSMQNVQQYDGKISNFYVHSGDFGSSDVTTLFDNTKTYYGY